MAPVHAPLETARLQALQSYAILDTPAEEAYDQLATLAARLCGTPMAVVNFLDSERQWFKAAVGVPFRQTDRAISFCTHALSGTRTPMVVADARQHPLFAVNPLVVGEPHVRLYACVPLITPEGAALGTLAVLDTVPRALTDEQLEGLKILAGQVMVLLELRRQQRLLSQLVQERDQMHAELVDQSETLRVAGSIARIGGWSLELPARQLNWSQEIVDTFGLAGRTGPVAQILALHTPPYRPALEQALEECIRDGTPFDLQSEALLAGERHFWVRTAGLAVRDAQGRVVRVQGAFQDITAQHQADQALRLSEERFHLVARATADAIWDWNLATDAMWWNEGMQHLFGIPPHEVLPDSRSWTLRLHPEDSAEVLQSIHAAVRGSASHWSAKYRFRRHDDSYAWVLDRGFLIRDGEGRAVRMVGGMADISAQRLAEIEAQRDAHNHAQLLQLQQRMSSIDLPLPEVLAMVARTVLDQTGARGAQVDLLEGQHLVVYASAGVMVRPLGHPLPVHMSLLWHTLSQARTIVCHDIEAEGWDLSHLPHSRGLRSVAAVPLRAGDTVVGSLLVTSDQPHAFSARSVAHLEILTESLGTMVQLRQVASKLHASELQYRMLFDEHPHPMWVYAKDSLRLLAVNQAMVAHYGYTEAELLQMELTDLCMPEDRPGLRERLKDVFLQPRDTSMVRRHLHKNGVPMHMDISAGNISFNGVPARQVLAIDITERLRTEDDLRRMGRAQRLLSACNEALVRATSETALLQEICQIAVDIGGYRMGWVGFALNDEAQTIEPVAHAGYNHGYIEQLQLSWSESSAFGRGPAGVAVRSGQPVIVQDIRTDDSFTDWTERMLEHGFHGVICLPLREREQTFGLLYLYAPEILHISGDETTLLQQLANDLAFGIMSLRARHEQQRLQASVLKMAAAVSASTGTEFFVQLASNMAEALGACVRWRDTAQQRIHAGWHAQPAAAQPAPGGDHGKRGAAVPRGAHPAQTGSASLCRAAAVQRRRRGGGHDLRAVPPAADQPRFRHLDAAHFCQPRLGRDRPADIRHAHSPPGIAARQSPGRHHRARSGAPHHLLEQECRAALWLVAIAGAGPVDRDPAVRRPHAVSPRHPGHPGAWRVERRNRAAAPRRQRHPCGRALDAGERRSGSEPFGAGHQHRHPRAQGHRARDPAPGVLRRAHRSTQPHAADGPHGPGAGQRPAAPAGRCAVVHRPR